MHKKLSRQMCAAEHLVDSSEEYSVQGVQLLAPMWVDTGGLNFQPVSDIMFLKYQRILIQKQRIAGL